MSRIIEPEQARYSGPYRRPGLDGHARKSEFRIRHRDGDIAVDCVHSAVPSSARGGPTWVAGKQIRDITARRTAEVRMARAEQRAIPDSSSDRPRESPRWLFRLVNPALAGPFGMSGRVAGDETDGFRSPESPFAAAEERLFRARRDGVQGTPLALRRKDGTVVWLQLQRERPSPMATPLGVLDVTDQRGAAGDDNANCPWRSSKVPAAS